MNDLVLIALCVIAYVIIYGVAIADYVIYSLGLYRIAKKRKVSNPWLAWIPVATTWTMGSIVDGFEAEKGRKRKLRVILLVLEIIYIVLVTVAIVAIVAVSTLIVAGIIALPYDVVQLAIVLYAIFIPISFLSIVYMALMLISLYKLHENICPEKSVKYLVLLLIVPLGRSLCMLKNSKRCEEKEVPAEEYMIAENRSDSEE